MSAQKSVKRFRQKGNTNFTRNIREMALFANKKHACMDMPSESSSEIVGNVIQHITFARMKATGVL